MLDTSRFCFGSGFVVVQSQVFSMKYMCTVNGVQKHLLHLMINYPLVLKSI